MIPHALVLDFKAILRRVAERSKVHFVRQLSSNLLRTGRKCRSVLYEDIVRAASTCKIFNDKTRFTLETLTDKKQQCEGKLLIIKLKKKLIAFRNTCFFLFARSNLGNFAVDSEQSTRTLHTVKPEGNAFRTSSILLFRAPPVVSWISLGESANL